MDHGSSPKGESSNPHLDPALQADAPVLAPGARRAPLQCAGHAQCITASSVIRPALQLLSQLAFMHRVKPTSPASQRRVNQREMPHVIF